MEIMTATKVITVKKIIDKVWLSFNKEKHIAPLAVFRMAFGAIMLISTVRFMLKGWVYDFYIAASVEFGK